jgi:hypothetical protein
VKSKATLYFQRAELMSIVGIFKSPERAVYLMSALLGMIVYLGLRPANWAWFAGLMVTYHLFLLYILFGAEKEASPSYSLPITIAGHIVCVAMLTASKILLREGATEIAKSLPLLMAALFILWAWKVLVVLQFLVTYVLATYERDFLFAGEHRVKKEKQKAAPVSVFAAPPPVPESGVPLITATGEDHNEWILDRERRKAVFYAPGTSAEHDFEQWLRVRGKTQYRATQAEQVTATD